MALRKSEQASPDRLVRLLDRSARLAQGREQAAGLQPVQWEILRYLAKANRFSRQPSALADWLGITRGTLSQSVKVLEAKGLVGRKPDPADRRSVALVLSEAGLETLGGDPNHLLRDALALLPKKQRRRLGEMLDYLLVNQTESAGLLTFGTCTECCHFMAEARLAGPKDQDPPAKKAPHRCAHFEVPLSDDETSQLCRAQSPEA